MLVWWNGRRVGLKIRCWRQHVGSSPTTSTNTLNLLVWGIFLCFFAKRIVYGAIRNRYGCFMPLQIAGNFPQTHWETLVCCKFGAGNGTLPEVVQFVHFRFRFAANKAQNSAYVVFYMHSRNQMRKNKQFFQ